MWLVLLPHCILGICQSVISKTSEFKWPLDHGLEQVRNIDLSISTILGKDHAPPSLLTSDPLVIASIWWEKSLWLRKGKRKRWMMVTRKVRTRGISIFWDKMRLTTSRALPILKLKQNDAGTHSIKFARARAAEKFNPADFFAVIAHLWSFSALVSLRRCRKGWRNKRGSQGEEVKDLIIVVLISTINCILPDMTSFSSSNTFYFQTYMPKDLKAGEELVPDMSAYEMLYHVS